MDGINMTHARKTLPLDDIRIDGGTQARVGIDEETVRVYAETPDGLPPLVVFWDGSTYWLADGFHRFHARRRAEKEDAECEVHQGSQDEALWYAIGANKTHGLRRTREDKRRAIELALKHRSKATDRLIADHVGVSPTTVGVVRSVLSKLDNTEEGEATPNESSHAHNGATPQPKRTGRDGREYNATKPQKSRPKGLPPLTDAGGRPVPDNLRDVFCDPCLPESIALVEGWLESLKDSRLIERAKARATFLPYLKIEQLIDKFEGAVASLAVCLEALQTAVPYAVCPSCEGEGCKHCRSSGYLPQWRKEEVEREEARS